MSTSPGKVTIPSMIPAAYPVFDVEVVFCGTREADGAHMFEAAFPAEMPYGRLLYAMQYVVPGHITPYSVDSIATNGGMLLYWWETPDGEPARPTRDLETEDAS